MPDDASHQKKLFIVLKENPETLSNLCFISIPVCLEDLPTISGLVRRKPPPLDSLSPQRAGLHAVNGVNGGEEFFFLSFSFDRQPINKSGRHASELSGSRSAAEKRLCCSAVLAAVRPGLDRRSPYSQHRTMAGKRLLV